MHSIARSLHQRRLGNHIELPNALENRAAEHLKKHQFFSTVVQHQSEIVHQANLHREREYVVLSHGYSTLLWDISKRWLLWKYAVSDIADENRNAYLSRTVFVDEDKRVLQIYFNSDQELVLEVLFSGKKQHTLNKKLNPKKIWMKHEHVFLMNYENRRIFLAVWDYAKGTCIDHFLEGEYPTYSIVDPVMNNYGFFFCLGSSLQNKLYIYRLDTGVLNSWIWNSPIHVIIRSGH